MSQYKPKISIVIPAYNASNYLSEAINSALAQTYDNFEIVVVNDGSKDDGATRAVAESYGYKIRYFEKENGGSSSALNRGIKEMTGEWFSWLSHDDLYKPEKLSRQVELLGKLAESGEDLERHIFFTGADLIDKDGKIIRSPGKERLLQIEHEVSSIKGNEYLVAKPTHYNFHGCGCLIHKNVLNKVGGFDEKLRLMNDIDLWYRLYTEGYKLHYIPEILVSGRVHAKQVSTQIGYSYHNPEQDMFWNRSLDWLIANHPNNFELFFSYGKNAYEKTRYAEGDRAFAFAQNISPEKSKLLRSTKLKMKTKAKIRNVLKKIYLKLKVKKG